MGTVQDILSTRYTERSTDVKLFPLAYNSQITTTLGLSAKVVEGMYRSLQGC